MLALASLVVARACSSRLYAGGEPPGSGLPKGQARGAVGATESGLPVGLATRAVGGGAGTKRALGLLSCKLATAADKALSVGEKVARVVLRHPLPEAGLVHALIAAS